MGSQISNAQLRVLGTGTGRCNGAVCVCAGVQRVRVRRGVGRGRRAAGGGRAAAGAGRAVLGAAARGAAGAAPHAPAPPHAARLARPGDVLERVDAGVAGGGRGRAAAGRAARARAASRAGPALCRSWAGVRVRAGGRRAGGRAGAAALCAPGLARARRLPRRAHRQHRAAPRALPRRALIVPAHALLEAKTRGLRGARTQAAEWHGRCACTVPLKDSYARWRRARKPSITCLMHRTDVAVSEARVPLTRS